MKTKRRNTILLRCLKKGCPRTKRYPYPTDFPKGVVEEHSYCPWHEGQGAKAYPQHYYDADGQDISERVNHPVARAVRRRKGKE